MKKFKLIKEYPGSPNLGTICEERNNKSSFCYYFEGEKNIGITKDQVENQPEYWEEVIEKDYEVLISKVIPQEILSVKRLSDGEIFTVGDRAMTQGSRGGHSIRQFKIKQKCNVRTPMPGIFIKDGIDRIWIDWEEGCGGNWLESTEKIIENDYEIISYVAKDNPTNITIKRRGAHLHEEYWNIHSVKRLSDGEIFTVGDSVKVYEYSYIKNITGIIININPLVKEGIWLRYDSGSSHLSHATKAKQPIFLTHDGKDIFAGDKVWWVNKKTLTSDYFVPTPSVTFFSDLNAYFLTQEAALDYIQRNKVLFITADGVGIKKGDMVHGVYRTSNTISNTVVGCNRGLHDTFEAIFSTRAAAENYLVQKSHSLSIEDFWEFVSWGGSTIAKSKRLKRLVKDRLNLK